MPTGLETSKTASFHRFLKYFCVKPINIMRESAKNPGRYDKTMKSGHEQRFAKGEVIIRQGSRGDRAYLIKAGQVIICKKGEPGEMVPIMKLGPGEMFGEMYLLSNNHMRNATVIAASEVIVNVFFEDVILPDFERMTPFQKIMINGLHSRLNEMNDNYVKLAVAANGTHNAAPARQFEPIPDPDSGQKLAAPPDNHL